MVKYKNISRSNKWRMDIEEELDYYNNQEDDQDYNLGYEY